MASFQLLLNTRLPLWKASSVARTRKRRSVLVQALLSRLNRFDRQLPGDPRGRSLRFKLDTN